MDTPEVQRLPVSMAGIAGGPAFRGFQARSAADSAGSDSAEAGMESHG
ncbi:hypothetical protein [Rhodococcus qingshengii]